MIQTFSSTIRRKEMDAVLTCMVDEKIGPGALNASFIQGIKEFFSCDGAVALRSPATALRYALKALDMQAGTSVMISALAPSWQILALEDMGYIPLVLDVSEDTGLVTPEAVEEGARNGGRVLLLHETCGILPDLERITALGIPFIEDISQSAGSVYQPAETEAGGDGAEETSAAQETVPAASGTGTAAESESTEGKKAGTFGTFSLMGLEERDVITGGGGAVLIAPGRREWIVLKKFTDSAPETDLLPDINSALASVQLKEYRRNEDKRKELYALYVRSLMSGKNRTFIRDPDAGSTVCCFPVIVSDSFKEAKQYAARKEIEITPAFEKSVIGIRTDELSPSCIHAKALLLRCALFPLYPRLGSSQVKKITKVLGTLP